MKTRRQPPFAACVAAFLLAVAANTAFAQASAPMGTTPVLPASAASAPASAAQVGPRLRSPAETGNRAAAPGDLRPERPVTPQISIPFGKTPPSPNGESRAPKRGNPAAASGTVDDAAARCESQADDQVRAACRAKLEREAKGRLPN